MSDFKICKKIPTITIDTLKSKIIKLPEKVFYSDSIELSFLIQENGINKQFEENCNIVVLYKTQMTNGETYTVEQTMSDLGNIELNVETSTLTIVPCDNAFEVGVVTIQITINDSDENITLSSILMQSQTTLDKGLLEPVEDKIKTLAELGSAVKKAEELGVEIESIGQEVDAFEVDIDRRMVETNSKIDNEIEAMNDRITNKNIEIDSVVIKNTKIVGYASGSYVYFKIPTELKASELVGTTLNITIVGSPYASTIINSCNMIVNFFVDTDGNIKTNKTTTNDVGVQGNYITPNMLFNYSPNTVGEIIVTTKIKKEYLSTANCYVCVFGRGL